MSESRFAGQQVSAFLDALASPEPTPGGGTAAAIAGAIGVSLLMMVAGLTKSRTGSEEERVALGEARASLTSIRDRLTALADADAGAFNQVMAAYRLAKGTDQEKASRKEAIQQALKSATTTPLDTLRAASDGFRIGQIVKQHGNPSAASDVDVGLGLLRAAAEGAAANVTINLESIQDAEFRKAATDSVAECRAVMAKTAFPA
jgi:formiminotetrahydrofolate cyclodeaminase